MRGYYTSRIYVSVAADDETDALRQLDDLFNLAQEAGQFALGFDKFHTMEYEAIDGEDEDPSA